MLTYILLWKQNHVLVMYLYPNLMETGQIAFFQKAKEIFSEDCGCKETSKNVEKVCAFKQQPVLTKMEDLLNPHTAAALVRR